MALSRLVFVLLQLAAFVTSAGTPQISLPANIEIDVIFPRSGETYAPVSPFPVVFAIQNAAVAWSFGFHFEWQIDLTAGTNNSVIADVGSMDIYPDAAANSLVPPEDPFLLINKSIELPNYPVETLSLVWQFGFFGNCTESADGTSYTFEGVPYNAKGSFNFNTAFSGKAVDVLAGGQCPTLGNIIPVQSSMGANCPHIADSGIKPNPCAFTIDAAVASSVSAAVVPTTTAGVTPTAGGGASGSPSGSVIGTGSVPTQTTATGTSTQISSSAGPTAAGPGSTSKNAGVRYTAGQGLTAVMAGIVGAGAVML